MKAAFGWTKFCLRKDGKNYILPQKASPKDKKMQKKNCTICHMQFSFKTAKKNKKHPKEPKTGKNLQKSWKK